MSGSRHSPEQAAILELLDRVVALEEQCRTLSVRVRCLRRDLDEARLALEARDGESQNRSTEPSS